MKQQRWGRGFGLSDLRHRVLQDLEQSGFPLEIEVGSLFANKGWEVRHQAIFREKGDEQTGYVDVLATKSLAGKFDRYHRLSLNVICECKKSAKRP